MSKLHTHTYTDVHLAAFRRAYRFLQSSPNPELLFIPPVEAPWIHVLSTSRGASEYASRVERTWHQLRLQAPPPCLPLISFPAGRSWYYTPVSVVFLPAGTDLPQSTAYEVLVAGATVRTRQHCQLDTVEFSRDDVCMAQLPVLDPEPFVDAVADALGVSAHRLVRWSTCWVVEPMPVDFCLQCGRPIWPDPWGALCRCAVRTPRDVAQVVARAPAEQRALICADSWINTSLIGPISDGDEDAIADALEKLADQRWKETAMLVRRMLAVISRDSDLVSVLMCLAQNIRDNHQYHVVTSVAQQFRPDITEDTVRHAVDLAAEGRVGDAIKLCNVVLSCDEFRQFLIRLQEELA